MVLTTEEERERQRIRSKKYRDNNKEKIKQYNKKYNDANNEKNKIECKVWRDNNKEKQKKYTKEYYQNNTEKIKEYRETPNSKKSKKISEWKTRGLVCEDYDSLYCHYLTANECDNCNIMFGEIGDGTRTFKCMDHDHQHGYFRNFLCCSCNIRRG